ncbi:MAG: GerW family sporulation protein [Ruminococcus sp.]|nr:GerW family sporulation protein [Ruminococcus sp.]MBQ1815817.1 GerW family sporulation protein [Ruminococcus sp.]MEE0857501.1 GerW family sporulation protein [Ruminococcus sp.]
MDHPIGNLMNTTMEKIKEMIDVNSIIGEPITSPDGTLIIPVSKVSYGFASGGSDLPTKKENKDCFGGGSGAGVTIKPVAFLTVYQGNVKLLSVDKQDGAIDVIADKLPEAIDKIHGFFKKDKKDKNNDFSEITVDDVDV